MNSHRQITRLAGVCALVALAATAAACGTSSPSWPPARRLAASPSAPATTPAASAGIRDVGRHRCDNHELGDLLQQQDARRKRVSLLQDGSQFASIITAQQNRWRRGLTAKVKSLKFTSTQADVKYDLVVGGLEGADDRKRGVSGRDMEGGRCDLLRSADPGGTQE